MDKKPKKFYRKIHRKESITSKKIIHKVTQSPNNNRSIAESRKKILTREWLQPKTPANKKMFYFVIMFLILVISSFALIGIRIFSRRVEDIYKQFAIIELDRARIQQQIVQWQEQALLHPGSRDIYVKLAILSYQVKDIDQAKAYTERALLVDPNYLPSLQLQKILVDK